MSIGFGGGIIFQVLYAIGGSFCLMVPLCRLGTFKLLVISLAIFLLGEKLAELAIWAGGGQQPGPAGALLITGLRRIDGIFVLYPLIPWLAYMILGWVCGKYMLASRFAAPVRFFSLAGAASLTVFFIVRGFNQYGNMQLFRYGNSVLQWLHVSKYPPSLSFASLELGIMFLMLAFLFAWYRSPQSSAYNPLLVFGRTPLFFYLIHVHLLAAGAWALNMHHTGGLPETFIAAAAVLLVLYPLCRWYGRVKKAHPGSLLRFL